VEIEFDLAKDAANLAFAYANGQGRCLVFTAIDSTTIRAISYRRARQKEMQRHGL
jgi:uncharacterized DUF497 family protein